MKNFFLRIVMIICLATLIMNMTGQADNQIWKQISVIESNTLRKTLDSYSVIIIFKYNYKDGEKVIELLKGKWSHQAVVTEEIYEMHKKLDAQSGDMYYMYFSRSEQEAKRSVQIDTLILNLGWNEKPSKIGVRSITGERRPRANPAEPELYVTVGDLKKYFTANPSVGSESPGSVKAP